MAYFLPKVLALLGLKLSSGENCFSLILQPWYLEVYLGYGETMDFRKILYAFVPRTGVKPLFPGCVYDGKLLPLFPRNHIARSGLIRPLPWELSLTPQFFEGGGTHLQLSLKVSMHLLIPWISNFDPWHLQEIHRLIVNLMRRNEVSFSVFHMTLDKFLGEHLSDQCAFFRREDAGIKYQRCFEKMFCTAMLLIILLQASIRAHY